MRRLRARRRESSGTRTSELEPPGIGDPTQLLELLAFTAAKRRAITSRHGHQTR